MIENITAPATVALQPLAYAIEDTPTVTGFSRTRIFEAVRGKELMARKSGRSTVIEVDELKRWLRSLPTRGREPNSGVAAA